MTQFKASGARPSRPRAESQVGGCVVDRPGCHAERTGDAGGRRIRAWLGKPTQPRWILIAAWTNAAWSSAAVVTLAITHDPALVAWWVLGSELLLVALVHLWTESSNVTATGGEDGGASTSSPGPAPRDGLSDIDRRRLEEEILVAGGGGSDWRRAADDRPMRHPSSPAARRKPGLRRLHAERPRHDHASRTLAGTKSHDAATRTATSRVLRISFPVSAGVTRRGLMPDRERRFRVPSPIDAAALELNPRRSTFLAFVAACIAGLALVPAALGAVSFAPPANFGVGSAPQSVAVGDFNGDGKPDLATANQNSSDVSVLLANGSGGFGVAASFAVGLSPVSVSVSDFNGDGKPDLVAANRDASSVSVLLGDGSGAFAAATSLAVGAGPVSVAVSDFNGDGNPDLVTANRDANSASVLRSR